MKTPRLAIGLATAAFLVLVAGCAAQSAVVPSSSPAINWTARLAAFTAKYGSNPAPDPPFTEDQAHEAAAAQADQQWGFLLKQYPEAVRPGDTFMHWGTSNDPDIAACMVAAGGTPETGVSANGVTSTGYSGPDSVGYAVATFDCEMVSYPVRQSPWPSTAQLGYYYDYLTHYLVPCYLAHGAKIDPGMPKREEFIAQNQRGYVGTRWQLTPPDAGDAPDPTYDGKTAVCSATGPGDAQQ